MVRRLQKLALPAACFCVLLLCLLSLVPLTPDQRTGAGPTLEHSFAYAVTTLLFFASGRFRFWAILAAMMALGAGLECAQALTTFRRAAFIDFLSSASGIVIGAAVGVGLNILLRRPQSKA